MTSLIPPNWSLPESILRRLGTSAGRQRLIAEDQHVLLILHGLPNADDPVHRDARLFWRNPTGTWHSSTEEAEATIAPLCAHVDRFHQAAESFEERIEKASNADDWFALLHQLGPFARTARHLSSVLQALRDHSGSDHAIISLRDRVTDVERAAELAYQWASQGLDYAIAKANEEQAKLSEYLSRASYRLNLLAAITLPLMALGSFLGMNLNNGLEHRGGPWLVWIIGALCLVFGAFLRSSFPSPPEPAARHTTPASVILRART